MSDNNLYFRYVNVKQLTCTASRIVLVHVSTMCFYPKSLLTADVFLSLNLHLSMRSTLAPVSSHINYHSQLLTGNLSLLLSQIDKFCVGLLSLMEDDLDTLLLQLFAEK